MIWKRNIWNNKLKDTRKGLQLFKPNAENLELTTPN
jgi:hypothetical protein